jgi:hypothetical protein
MDVLIFICSRVSGMMQFAMEQTKKLFANLGNSVTEALAIIR